MLDVRDAVADDDDLAFLALHPVNGLDERRPVPGPGGRQGAADRLDLDVVRADDEEPVLPERGIALAGVGVSAARAGLEPLA